MRALRRALVCLCLLLPALGTAAPLAARVAEVLSAGHLPSSAESYVLIEADSGKLIASQLPDTPRSPASTIKTVTTFAALDMLGPSFVWHTQAYVRGALKEGVLDGDLYLQGGGDPYMTLERWWAFVQALRARGLKRIHGDIVIDESAFSLADDNPASFDGKPNRAYNVVPGALIVNFQSVDFRVAANAETHHVDISLNPAPVNLVVDNRVRYAPGRCSAASGQVEFDVASDSWDRVVFSGALSPACAERSFSRVLLSAPTYAYGTFLQLWRQAGGEFDGKLRIEPVPPDAHSLYTADSLTLGEIIRLTNKYSNNLMARHLLLSIGAERFGVPATLDKGASVMAEWAKTRGLDLSNIDIDNGAGLSRKTHISVLQMARVLDAAFHSHFAPEFLASLPLAGLDGTLRSRMKTSPAGTVRLKTGHIDGVSGVAGFVSTAAGKTYVLVSIVNHERADYGAAEPVHAAIVAWIQDNL